MKEPKAVYFSIDENSRGQIQLALNYRGSGYRICGPKYDGTGRTIKSHEITLSDIKEIQSYLDAAEAELTDNSGAK
jgi:hypothetical protein